MKGRADRAVYAPACSFCVAELPIIRETIPNTQIGLYFLCFFKIKGMCVIISVTVQMIYESCGYFFCLHLA